MSALIRIIRALFSRIPSWMRRLRDAAKRGYQSFLRAWNALPSWVRALIRAALSPAGAGVYELWRALSQYF